MNYKACCLAIILLIAPSTVMAFGKQPDRLQIEDNIFELRSSFIYPLEASFDFTDVATLLTSYMNCNGEKYIATWELSGVKLFLVKIAATDKPTKTQPPENSESRSTIALTTFFPDAEDPTRILADWFSGTLLAQSGKETIQIRDGWTSTQYTTNKFLRFKDGQLVKETTLSGKELREAMGTYYGQRNSPNKIVGNAAEYQKYRYSTPKRQDQPNEEYLKSSKRRVQDEERLHFDNWKYSINSANLSPDRILSYDATLTYNGNIPIRIDVSRILKGSYHGLLIWPKDCGQSFRMCVQPETEIRYVDPLGETDKVVLPGDTFHIQWKYQENWNTKFMKTSEINTVDTWNASGETLHIGEQYIVDGLTTINSSSYDSLFQKGVKIISSTKCLAVVEDNAQ